jgi:hypothetical protein
MRSSVPLRLLATLVCCALPFAVRAPPESNLPTPSAPYPRRRPVVPVTLGDPRPPTAPRAWSS